MAAQPVTRIQLCGPLVVMRGDRRIEDVLPGRQGRLLFAYLTVNRHRRASRDELAEAIWPGEPPSAPAVALSALLSKHRRALGPEALEGKSDLRLDVPGAWIDLEAAEHAIHEAESAAAQELRRRVDDIRLRAMETAAECSLAIGGAELPLAEKHARRLVARSPFHERGHALLMRVLETRSDVAEAMLVYDRLRRLLHDELGIAPGPELQALHARLLRRETPLTAR